MKNLVLFVLIFSFTIVFSQNSNDKTDVKVGLVLSGGGAKGLAHVSVLKVLEEAGVRVDYIGGTSMGAIIGALYASGYTANQLDSIVKSINFTKILSGELPRKAKPFYEKENGEKYAISLPIQNGKIGIPTAISEGQSVLNLLTQLTQHVNHINDFSKLPIPFVCIATNLETGKQEVLKSGFLPKAVKASGSFPTLLAPVEIGGKILTDGGIVNNFPVDEVKAMGADVIIGVDIQSGLDSKEELNSAVKILNQIVGFQMYATLDHKFENVDVLIKPDLKDYNVVSFDKTTEIMAAGDSAARSNYLEIEAIALKQNGNVKEKINTSLVEKFRIDSIEINGNSNYTRAYILGKLNLKNKEFTTYKKLIESIDNLTATGNFQSIQYEIINHKDANTIKFEVKENKVSKFLQIGAHYDDLYKTAVLLNFTAKHTLSKNDILSADVILGDNVRYNFDYFIDNGFYWSFGLKSRFNTFNANVNFDEANVNKINLVYEDFTNQLYFQTVFNRKFALGVGGEFKRLKAFTETITSLENNSQLQNDSRLFFDKSNYLNVFTYLKIDTFDKKYFQKNGFFLDVNYKWLLASSDYNDNFSPISQVKGKLEFAYTFLSKLTFHFTSEAGLIFGDNENRVLDFNVGGYGQNFINNFIPMYGYDFAELNAAGFLRSSFTFRHEFLPKNYFMATANFARVEKDLFNEGNIFANTKSGYMLGYGLDTLIGPIEVNYSWSPDHSKRYWYFNVGYWF